MTPASGSRSASSSRSASGSRSASSSSALLLERLRSQLLAGAPVKDAVTVAERLLAVQGQDPRGFRLAVRARSSTLTVADVDRALSVERSLVVSWLCRGTLQLVRSEDYPWLQQLTTPPLFTPVMRRLSQEGVNPDDAERGVDAIVRALALDGPLTRAQLAVKVEAVGVPTAGQALIHLLFLTAIRGEIVRGPMIGKQHAYVLVRDWLGAAGALGAPGDARDAAGRTPGAAAARDRDVALAELARRYLAGHQPASDRDLARWAGLPLRDARAGLSAIGSELSERPDGLLSLRRGSDFDPEPPPPRLLGAFDPVLIGWRDREFVTGAHDSAVIRGGLFRPSATVRGRVVGAWGLEGGRVALEPLERISAGELRALEADGEAVVAYLGL
ncbi:MAG: winged helix DNA-binding domain-containing protein [Solirubrobacteraceae bacterium]